MLMPAADADARYSYTAQDQNQRQQAHAEQAWEEYKTSMENIKQEEEQAKKERRKNRQIRNTQIRHDVEAVHRETERLRKLLHYTKPEPVTPRPHQNEDYLLLENIKQEMVENIKQGKEQAKKEAIAFYRTGRETAEETAERLGREAQTNRAKELKDRIQELQDLMDQKENLMDLMDLKDLKDLMDQKGEYARLADKDDLHERTKREKGKETKRGSATAVPMGSTKAPLPSRLIRQALTLIRNIIRNVNARENSYKEEVFPGGGFPTGTPASSNASYNSSYCSDESEDGVVSTEQRENVRQMVKDPEQRRLWREEMKEMKGCQKDNNDKIFSWFDYEDRENLGRKLGFPEEEPVRFPTANLKTKGNSSDRDEAQTTQEDQEK